MLIFGIGRFAYESYYIGADEIGAVLTENDYQESEEFKNTVLDRFYTFLDAATGNYHGDSGYTGATVTEESIDSYLLSGGNFFDRLFGKENDIPGYVVSDTVSENAYESSDVAS